MNFKRILNIFNFIIALLIVVLLAGYFLFHPDGSVSQDEDSVLIGAILAELAEYEEQIKQNTWHPYYREYCAHLGVSVLVTMGERTRCGIALDVLEDGALRVACETGIEDLRGGEITLRSAQFYEN